MKKITLTIMMMFLLLLSGCTASPPISPSEEIVMYSWKLKNENEGTANKKTDGLLYFDEEKINLTLKKADGSELKINDFFEIDDSNIIIISEKLGTVKLKYKLKGKELELSLDDSSLYFDKYDKYID